MTLNSQLIQYELIKWIRVHFEQIKTKQFSCALRSLLLFVIELLFFAYSSVSFGCLHFERDCIFHRCYKGKTEDVFFFIILVKNQLRMCACVKRNKIVRVKEEKSKQTMNEVCKNNIFRPFWPLHSDCISFTYARYMYFICML